MIRNIRFEEKLSKWLSADLHIHSIFSGGTHQPEEILRFAQTHFLDVVAICDHDEVTGAVAAKQLATNNPDYPVTLIGQEISGGDHVHFLLLGANLISGSKTRNIVDRICEHHAAGGATILAHPWTAIKNSWAVGCLKEIIAAGCLDGMELFNSSLLEMPRRADSILQSIWDEWIAPYQLAVIGGSDFHRMNQGRFPGLGRTYLKVITTDVEGVIDSLRQRRTVAGLFNCQTLNQEWNGDGQPYMLLGREPWLSELQDLRRDIVNYLNGPFCFEPYYQKFIAALVAAGHLQHALDIINR